MWFMSKIYAEAIVGHQEELEKWIILISQETGSFTAESNHEKQE